MSINPLLLVGLFELLSVACIIWIWRKTDTTKHKIYWSLVAAIPLIRPVFLGAFYDQPSELPDHLKSKVDWDVVPRDYGSRNVHDDDD